MTELAECMQRVRELEHEVLWHRGVRQYELMHMIRYERLMSDLVRRTMPRFPWPKS